MYALLLLLHDTIAKLLQLRNIESNVNSSFHFVLGGDTIVSFSINFNHEYRTCTSIHITPYTHIYASTAVENVFRKKHRTIFILMLFSRRSLRILANKWHSCPSNVYSTWLTKWLSCVCVLFALGICESFYSVFILCSMNCKTASATS